MTWLILSLILIPLLAFLIYPLRIDSRIVSMREIEGPSLRLKELREQKATLVLALRELDFDFETGKLSAEDYKQMRDKYQASTVEVMKQLDEMEASWKAVQERLDTRLAGGSDSKARGSATIGTAAGTKCPRCGHGIGGADRFCTQCGATMAVFCTSCGAPMKGSDRFCSGCGQARGKGAHA